MTNLKVIAFISFVLIFIQNASAFDHESYFEKSILNYLKDVKGSFTSKTKVEDEPAELYEYTERFSFKENAGETIKIIDKDNYEKIINMNNLKRYYSLDLKNDDCIHGTDIVSKLKKWLPFRTPIEYGEHVIMGPSYVLSYLLIMYAKDKSKVECKFINQNKGKNQTECLLKADDFDTLVYRFENTDQYTMYPISFMVRNSLGSEWNTNFRYLSFETSLEKEIPPVNFPVGFGCKQFVNKNDPKLEDNLNQLNLSLSFEYYINNDNEKGWKIGNVNIYTLGSDLNSALIAAEGFNEGTKEKTKSTYNKRTQVDNHYREGKCSRISWKHSSALFFNWYYIQDLIGAHPEFFFAKHRHNKNGPFAYLGKHKEDKTEYHVFEKIFRSNSFTYGYIIASHYYDTSDLTTPKKMQFKLKNAYKGDDYGNFTIKNINSYKELDRRVFNLPKCFLNIKHDQITIKFSTEDQKNLKVVKEDLDQFERKFSSAVDFISPVRVSGIKAHLKEKSVDVDIKLYGVRDSENSFNLQNKGVEMNDRIPYQAHENVPNMTMCTSICIESKDCSLLSYDSQTKTCKVLIEEGFNEDFDGKKYNWERIQKIKKDNKNSILGYRDLQFDFQQDASNEAFIDYFKELIKNKKIQFEVVAKDKTLNFRAYDIKVNSKDEDNEDNDKDKDELEKEKKKLKEERIAFEKEKLEFENIKKEHQKELDEKNKKLLKEKLRLKEEEDRLEKKKSELEDKEKSLTFCEKLCKRKWLQ